MTEMNTENNLEAMQRAHGPLLEVKNLQVDFTTDEGKAVHAVRNSSFSVYPGQWVAIVGESGSGKSTSAMAVLGLLPGTGHVVGGSIKLDGQEISGFKQKDFDKLRGSKMGLVPQDPMSNLNPVWRIGTQVKEALVANNMDIDHEKRSEFAKALAGDEVELKGNDDETFLGSKELPDLIAAAKEALVKIGKSGDELDKIMARFAEEWVPGSETRWRVADGLIKAGVKDDDAWYIAKKYVVGSTMGDRIAGLLSEAGLPDAATRARQCPPEFSGGVPVLNAGDGANQHPTQTLLDLFTIQETQGRLENLNVAMVGDLKYGRTVHSLTQALAKFNGNRFYFIAPDALAMPQYILDMLDEKGIAWSLHSAIDDVMAEVDILYMTRVQKERLDPSEYANVKAQFVLRAADLEGARANMKVLHPLPRIDEITTDVDKTPHAWYFQQAGNGIFARQALLALVLNSELAL